MAGTIEFADLNLLLREDYFYFTSTLNQLEYYCKWRKHDSLHQTRRIEYPWVDIQLKKVIRSQDLILDAGSGKTLFSFASGMKHGYRAVCVDYDAEAVSDMTNIGPGDRMYEVGDITDLRFPADKFDATICVSVLEHLPKHQINDTVLELLRVTKPGGSVILTMDYVVDTDDPNVFNINDVPPFQKFFDLKILQCTPSIFKIDNTFYCVLMAVIHKEE